MAKLTSDQIRKALKSLKESSAALEIALKREPITADAIKQFFEVISIANIVIVQNMLAISELDERLKRIEGQQD